MDDTPNLLTLAAEDEGERLDQFVAATLPDLSRSKVQQMVKAGEILVNSQPVKASYRLQTGDSVSIHLTQPEIEEVAAEEIDLEVIYEDDDLVAINKPAGMVVHPAYGHRSGTVVNAALARWPQMAEVGVTADQSDRAGVVHRLDKDTSGVLVLAKTIGALDALQAQFKARTVTKRYLALVDGIPESHTGVIDAPIGRDPKQRKKMAVTRDGRPARTRYKVVEEFHGHAFLEIEIETGRTHQIRVHLAWLGYPVVADRVYGRRKATIKMKRLFLHAEQLHLDSPSRGERIEMFAPLPSNLDGILEKLRR
ncbi:MAG: RluA family pseudouridine synthase [Chloroflexi bacterium]|nr:RluA family pseudouridine synthase [Chloroflexota bacterium]